MKKRKISDIEDQLPTTVMLPDMLNQARPEVFGPRFEKIVRLYRKTYDGTPSLPDKVVLQLALWDYLATELAEQNAEYLVHCVNTVLNQHVGKALANTDLVETVSRH